MGGSSTRMGADKALIDVGGQTMGLRACRALSGAGAQRCAAIGGDRSWVTELDIEYVPDDMPGEGPLAAISTALRWAASHSEIVVITACDHPGIRSSDLSSLITALTMDPNSYISQAKSANGVIQPFPSAWRTILNDEVRVLVLGGERRAQKGRIAKVVEVELSPETLIDVDTPEDLDQWNGLQTPK